MSMHDLGEVRILQYFLLSISDTLVVFSEFKMMFFIFFFDQYSDVGNRKIDFILTSCPLTLKCQGILSKYVRKWLLLAFIAAEFGDVFRNPETIIDGWF